MANKNQKTEDEFLKELPSELPKEIKIPDDVKKKFEQIKTKLDKFKKEILKKFDKYIVGITLLPPPKPTPPETKIDFSNIYVLVLVDDSDTKPIDKLQLKTKLSAILSKTASTIDKNIQVNTMLLAELRENCFDGKYEILQMIATSAPIYDPKDMLAAIKVAEVHKAMVIKKFEKYVVSYVAAGSLFRGEKSNDIDVYVVIDDTDVKRMSRIELKDKLGAIIRTMGFEASAITNVKKVFHVQVYILTDFWDSIKDAQPVIFTFLRDGVPLYDKGVFMPWKLLLQMGRIRPSPEAIDTNMSIGEKLLERAQFKILSAVSEDIYYATLNPSQAALMLYGVSPPTPEETIQLLEEIFVKKEKLLEKEYTEILKKIRKAYKDIEHKKIKEISGKEFDSLLEDAKKYLKRIKTLFKQIEKQKKKENFEDVYKTCIKITKDALNIKEKISEQTLLKKFKGLVEQKRLPQETLQHIKELIKTKKEYSKLTTQEVEKVKKNARTFARTMIEFIQRSRGKELERCKIRFKYGDKFGEILLLDKIAFIVNNLDAKEKEISKAQIKPNGSLSDIQKSNLKELEEHIAKAKIPKHTLIKEKIFEDLKKLFGSDIEILVGN